MQIDGFNTISWDARREIIVPGDKETTLNFCVEHFLFLAHEAIKRRGKFTVALSGGSTPKALFELLTSPAHKNELDWTKIHLYWGDERSCAPTSPESNYHMALEAGFKNLPVRIYRMQAEEKIQEHALDYEKLLPASFDLIMLGMGDDGHTASLFPHTTALHENTHLVTANFVPRLNTWRMTLTYKCINAAAHTTIYVLGASKKEMLSQIFLSPDDYDTLPSQKIGTPTHKALWIADKDAATLLLPHFKGKHIH